MEWESPLSVVGSSREMEFRADDIIVLATKTFDTADALGELAPYVAPCTPVVCAQNGVENERLAKRYFEVVLGAYVYIMAAHLRPGVVKYYTEPSAGIFDVGPASLGHRAMEVAETVASDMGTAGFDAEARHDIMPWKYAKLLENLGNVLHAARGPTCLERPDMRHLFDEAVEEGKRCFEAASIEYLPLETARVRRSGMAPSAVEGEDFPGGSSWQSLQRQSGRIETDFFNGEIVMLGRCWGVATPVNLGLQQLGHYMIRKRLRAESMTESQVISIIRSSA